MTHANAPLSIEGRRRLVERCKTRPIAHVAAEMGISRACASKWVNRYRRHDELGLHDLPSTPRRQPTATDAAVVARIEDLRRSQKWPAFRIAFELQTEGVTISRRTVSRHLLALGLNHRKFIDPNGQSNREPRKINGGGPGGQLLLLGSCRRPPLGRSLDVGCDTPLGCTVRTSRPCHPGLGRSRLRSHGFQSFLAGVGAVVQGRRSGPGAGAEPGLPSPGKASAPVGAVQQCPEVRRRSSAAGPVAITPTRGPRSGRAGAPERPGRCRGRCGPRSVRGFRRRCGQW